MSITREQIQPYIPGQLNDEQIERLIDRHIEPEPNGFSIANARLKESGSSVAAIIAELEALDGDVHRTATDFNATVDQVLAAIFFYWKHQNVVDAEITLRRSAFM